MYRFEHSFFALCVLYFLFYKSLFRETQLVVDIIIKKIPEPAVHALDKNVEDDR